MAKYGSFNTRVTPQSEPVPGLQMVKNKAGGYAFQADDWTRLRRFLILGSDNGSFYADEKTLTRENAEVVLRCLQEDGPRVVDTIVDVSHSGLAPDNDPAIFALAMVTGFGDDMARKEAFDSLNLVCRIPTHLFHFARFVEQFRGWGRGLRKAVARWYLTKDVDDLAFHLVKYQQRDGWSNADLLRLSHPKGATDAQSAVFKWAMGKWDQVPDEIPAGQLDLAPIFSFETLKRATTLKEVTTILKNSRLPREAVPTEWLNSPEVWEVLLETMPVTAMVRNLGKIAALGMTSSNMSDATIRISNLLHDIDAIRRSRVHPMQLLAAQKVYARGHGEKGKLNWVANQRVVDALDDAFYMAFDNVQPTGKKLMVAIDESGSMRQAMKSRTPISCYEAALAQAIVFARTEPNVDFVGFDQALYDMAISPKMRLTELLKRGGHMLGTDCSLPYSAMRKNGVKYDALVMFTDLESWAGDNHTFQALDAYRREVNPDFRFVASAQVANDTTLIKSGDVKSLELVGFDPSMPTLVSAFLRGEF